MSTLGLLLKFLPVVLEIIRLIQRNRLSKEATKEVLDSFRQNGEIMVLKAEKARAEVSDDPDAIENDPYNRDRY